MGFGFTNDQERFDRANTFREAAIKDGWEATAMYGKTEPLERAAKLTKDGFIAHIITRSGDNGKSHGKWKFEAGVHLWGPDGLMVKPPKEYDFTAIQAGVARCHSCGAIGVETQRYSFAGRCCAECRPAMAKEHEQPGWTS